MPTQNHPHLTLRPDENMQKAVDRLVRDNIADNKSEAVRMLAQSGVHAASRLPNKLEPTAELVRTYEKTLQFTYRDKRQRSQRAKHLARRHLVKQALDHGGEEKDDMLRGVLDKIANMAGMDLQELVAALQENTEAVAQALEDDEAMPDETAEAAVMNSRRRKGKRKKRK